MTKSNPDKPAVIARKQRSAEALRANLQRRKQLTRTKKAAQKTNEENSTRPKNDTIEK